MPKRIITLDDIYKALKTHDAEILKHFDDDELSDEYYLFYAINSEIMSNGLGIVTNLMYGNEESVGIDQNCRSLIEAFVILGMLGEKEINEDQMKLFRYQYALVEKHNFSSMISDGIKEKAAEWKHLEEDYAIAKAQLCKILGVTNSELNRLSRGKYPLVPLDDPCLYLKRFPSDKISFDDLTKKYRIFGDETNNVYRFFSLYIHPRFEMDDSLEASFSSLRKKHINIVIDYLVKYLAKCKLFVFDKEVSGFEQDFLNNPILVNNIRNIEQVETSFVCLTNQLRTLKNGLDIYTSRFLNILRALMVDFMISQTLGYGEQVIGKYKPMMEYIAVSDHLNSVGSLKEFVARKLGFCLSSRLQVAEYVRRVLKGEAFMPDDEIKKVYESFYKDSYGVEYDYFLDKMTHNSLYAISNEKKSYNALVSGAIEKIMPSDARMIKLYRLSKDMSHASGYSFNSSIGIANAFSHLAIAFSWKMILQYIIEASKNVSKKDHEVHLEPIIKLFKALHDLELNESKKILKQKN